MHPRQLIRLITAVLAVYFIYMGTLGAPGNHSSGTTSSGGPALYPVAKVVDGDTIEVLKDSERVTVRLIGINTPETVDPRRPVQCFGKEASVEAHRVLAGQSVSLETDPSQDTYDKYGRLLAYTFLPDGSLFNEHMIAAGFAHEYTYDQPYKYQKQFKEAEQAARFAGRGLWALSTCAGDTTQAAQ
ncbi:nuclease [Candidatus Kaiserbacteria bacterium]|nr:nuclease [Candidatus Kaiserbacteria bacterium]